MKLIALKVDVDTCRGANEGVPRLLAALAEREAHASFFFNLGPDQSGRALGAILQAGWRSRGTRISLLAHYGWRTCLRGTLLPAPDMGVHCAEPMRAVCEAGHEAGIRAWNRQRWLSGLAQAEVGWTLRELTLAAQRYQTVFSAPAPSFAAPGWKTNRTALRWQQQQGMRYASDTRGTHPFWPVIEGEPVRCLQLPTTLPTLSELVTQHGFDEERLVAMLLQQTESAAPCGHVFSLSAEFEGLQWLPLFERLLDGWRAQGYQLVTLATYYRTLDPAAHPYHELVEGNVPGLLGAVAMQGQAFPVV